MSNPVPSATASSRSRGWMSLRAWLQLFRLPNLLTVPGDPIAGFFLAQWMRNDAPAATALFCAVSSLLLYMAGLISNDYFDLDEDRLARPDRPLPSGLVNPTAAITIAILLAALGVTAAGCAGHTAAIVSVILVAAIASYNMKLKRSPCLGPLNMGICRGLSLLLGAAAAGAAGLRSVPVLGAAAGLTLYVAAVTRIASQETQPVEIGPNRSRPTTSIATCFLLIAYYIISVCGHVVGVGRIGEIVAVTIALCAVAWAWHCGRLLAGTPAPMVVSATIGRFLRGLLLIQAVFCAMSGEAGLVTAGVLVVLFPVSAILGRWFYAS